jgi:hypothetical protein
MDTVKEAVLEQKIDDLALRFDRVEDRIRDSEERNREEHRNAQDRNLEEHRQFRSDIGDMRGDIQHLSRTMALGFASIAASVVGGFVAVLATHAI